MEHADGGRLIARVGREEAAKLLPRLVLGGHARGRLEALGPPLRSDRRREIGKLLRLESHELVTGLRRLQRPCRALAGIDQGGHLGAVGVEITDHRRLNAQSILQARHGILPTRLRIGDQRLGRLIRRCRRIGRRKGPIDLLDIVGDVLRLQQEVDGDSIALRFRAPQREMRFNQARQDVGNAGTCATKACKEFAARVIPSSICR